MKMYFCLNTKVCLKIAFSSHSSTTENLKIPRNYFLVIVCDILKQESYMTPLNPNHPFPLLSQKCAVFSENKHEFSQFRGDFWL